MIQELTDSLGADEDKAQRRVSLAVDHCSTGGTPAWALGGVSLSHSKICHMCEWLGETAGPSSRAATTRMTILLG